MDNSDKKNHKISALIITKNEENNIGKCLESIKWVDEIIILDSQSRDRTVEICKSYTDKVFSVEWMGYAKTKNLGIEKTAGDWILWVDADEEVSPALAEEIKAVLSNPKSDGFYVSRKSQFLGKWIKHCGWYPDYVLRLFRKGKGQFDEAKKVHEGIALDGEAGYLKKELLHRPYLSLDEYLKKFNRYTSLSADEMHEKGRKTRLYHLVFYPGFVFFKKYILKLGILDGVEGFILCVFNAFYVFAKYVKLWYKRR